MFIVGYWRLAHISQIAFHHGEAHSHDATSCAISLVVVDHSAFVKAREQS
jgi:hypothetical protein